MAFLMGTALTVTSAADAQLLYLHSQTEEMTADEVKTTLDAAKKAHLEAIDKHKTYLEKSIKREAQLVTERDLALRDSALLHALDARNRNAAAGVSDLKASIFSRLRMLTGTVQEISPKDFLYLRTRGRLIRDAKARVQDNRTRLKREILLFKSAGGEGQACDENGVGTEAAATKGGANPGLFDAIWMTCRLIAADLEDIGKYYSGSPSPLIAALLGDPTKVANLGGSEIGWAVVQEQSINALLSAQGKLAAAAEKHLKELQAFHKCEVERAEAGGGAEGVQAAATSLEKFIDWLSTRSGADPKLLEDAPEENSQAQSSSCAKPVWPDGGLLELAGLDASELQGWLEVADDVQPFRSVLAAAQAQAHEFKAGILSQIVAALANPVATEGQRREAVLAASLLRLYGNAEQLGRARAGQTPNLSGTLVRLAAAEMQQRTAQLEMARLKRVAQLSASRTAALSREMETLSAAAADLEGQNPDFDEALLGYSDSWTVGRIPADALRREMTNASYITWIERERAVVEAAYAALEPASAQLQAYGRGGVKPSDLAGYLHTLGLGAIALGD